MATGVNKVILIGNLGKDPEVMAFESGRKKANFPLATTETYKDRNGERAERTEWHNIVIWGKTAEVVEKYLRKGSKVYVEGRIQTRSYEDKEGNTRYITEIVGQNMTMLGGKDEAGGGSSSTPEYYEDQSASAPAGVSAEQQDQSDDLPF